MWTSGRDFQIALVFNLEHTIKKGTPQELIALQDTAVSTQNLYDALCSLGYSVTRVAAQDSLDDFACRLGAFSPEHTFVFFNCDGFEGENWGAVRIAEKIEQMGYAHTGSLAQTIALVTDKPRAKQALLDAGVPTPAFEVFASPSGNTQLDFPLIVKPAVEDASMGIDLQSVVMNPLQLYERVQYILETYDQPALVEEYILGRELSVSLWGNETVEVMPLYEEDYSQIADPLHWLLTYEAKWVPESHDYNCIFVRCPADVPEVEARIVREMTIRAYRAMGMRDFGRMDVRLRDGIPYIIDINDLPDLSIGSGFPQNAKVAGYDYVEMVERILDLALRREGWRV